MAVNPILRGRKVVIRSNPENNLMTMDEKVAAACRDAGRQAIEVAERTGTSIVIGRDGKIVHLTAAEARGEFVLAQRK
jgi:hypothetical protein